MRYSTFRKQASTLGWLALASRGFGEMSDAQRLIAGAIILSSAFVGGTGGFLAAKATAHNMTDFNLAKKEYENEQVKADIGYLNSKLNDEFTPQGNQRKQKSVRMLEV